MSLDIINARRLKTILVTETEVKTETSISANKAETTLIPFIITAQNIKIKKALGATLYDNLVAEFLANGNNSSLLPDGTATGTAPQITGDETDYKTLYELVYWSLCWWAYTLSITPTSAVVSEQGVIKRYTDNATAAEKDEVREVKAEAEAIARAYTQELINHLNISSGCDEDSTNTEDLTNGQGLDVGGASMGGVFVAPKPWHGGSNF